MTDTRQTVHVASLMESCTSLLLILWKSAIKLEKPSNSASSPKKAILLFCYATLPHNNFEREAASISSSINIPSSIHCLHFKSLLNHYPVIETALKRSSKSAAPSHTERKLRYLLHSCFWLFVLYTKFKADVCWKIFPVICFCCNSLSNYSLSFGSCTKLLALSNIS